MIGLIAKLVGPTAAPFVAWGGAIALIVGALVWMRVDAYNDGKRAVIERLEREAAEADRRALEAERAADEAAEVRQQEAENEAEVLRNVITQATSSGDNSLDALLGSMSTEAD